MSHHHFSPFAATSHIIVRTINVAKILSYFTFLVLQVDDGNKVEYRVWNPFRSKLAAAILGGIDKIHMKPGSKVLYLGAASGTTVSHVSDIVGPVCTMYIVLFLQEE